MPESSIPPPGQIKPWAILLAAGQGSRLAAAADGRAKQFLPWRGAPLYWHSARAMSRSAVVAGIVFVFPQNGHAEHEERLRELHAAEDLGIPWLTAVGGEMRQDSVRNALCVLPADARHVLIHDAARPFLTPALVRSVCEAANVALTQVKRPFALQEWGRKMAEAKGAKRARTAVARKLAALLHSLWLNETEFRWA